MLLEGSGVPQYHACMERFSLRNMKSFKTILGIFRVAVMGPGYVASAGQLDIIKKKLD